MQIFRNKTNKLACGELFLEIYMARRTPEQKESRIAAILRMGALNCYSCLGYHDERTKQLQII